MRLDFRDPDPEVIDLSPAGGLVSTLKESRVDCLATDKVCFSAFFSNGCYKSFPGRLLVLLPVTLPRTLSRLPVFYRWYTAIDATDGVIGAQCISTTFAARATAASEES